MLELRWKRERLFAAFYIPGDQENVLRVEFERALIVRILDEMPLSTEGDEPDTFEGHVPDHFAYRTEGSWFWRTQSEAFTSINKDLKAYLLVTGGTCLEVISPAPPKLRVTAKEAPLEITESENGR
jgi:hypothetical protein